MAGRRTYHARACVLDRTKLGETDLILTLLGSNGAQLRAVAKGARKPGGRLAGKVQLFCECDLLLACGKSLDVVSEASLVDAHAALRGDLERVSAASCVCEVARLCCFEDAEDPFLYAITSRALKACEEARDRAHLDLVCAAFAWKVLAHAGWRPELDGCCACLALLAARGRASVRELRQGRRRRRAGEPLAGLVAARASFRHLRRAAGGARGRAGLGLAPLVRPPLVRGPS